MKRSGSKQPHAAFGIADRLLKNYLAGKDTDTGVILDLLNISDETTIRDAVTVLPPDLCERLAAFVNHYGPETQIFNGPRPKMRTVQIVRRLLSQANGVPQRSAPRPTPTARRKTKGSG